MTRKYDISEVYAIIALTVTVTYILKDYITEILNTVRPHIGIIALTMALFFGGIGISILIFVYKQEIASALRRIKIRKKKEEKTC